MFLPGDGATVGVGSFVFLLNNSLEKREMLAILGLGAILVKASLFFLLSMSIANSLDFSIILLILSDFLARSQPGVFLFSLSSLEILRRVFPKETAITFLRGDQWTEKEMGLLVGTFWHMFQLVTVGALLRSLSVLTELQRALSSGSVSDFYSFLRQLMMRGIFSLFFLRRMQRAKRNPLLKRSMSPYTMAGNYFSWESLLLFLRVAVWRMMSARASQSSSFLTSATSLCRQQVLSLGSIHFSRSITSSPQVITILPGEKHPKTKSEACRARRDCTMGQKVLRIYCSWKGRGVWARLRPQSSFSRLDFTLGRRKPCPYLTGRMSAGVGCCASGRGGRVLSWQSQMVLVGLWRRRICVGWKERMAKSEWGVIGRIICLQQVLLILIHQTHLGKGQREREVTM